MAVEVILPRFNMDMEEGTILRWLKQDGEHVRQDEPICEVETNKVNMEVEAPADGILCRPWIQEGATVPVTSVLAVIAADETEARSLHEAPLPAHAEPPASPEPGPAAPALPAASPSRPLATAPAGSDGIRATPAVRRAAREAGIDLTSLAGAGGRVSMEDVQRAISTARGKSGAGAPLSPLRRTIAARMTLAHAAPHVTLDVEVRFHKLQQLRGAWTGAKPSVTAMLAVAICRALRKHPLLNSTFHGQALVTTPTVNLGFAVARPDGLVAPNLKDAHLLGVSDMSVRLGELVQRARDGSLTLEDTAGGTFTLTNLGPAGVDRFTALMNPPEVAILAAGRICDRAVPGPAGIDVAPVGWLSLTIDHRIVDGQPAAEFLATLRELLEEPAWMVD